MPFALLSIVIVGAVVGVSAAYIPRDVASGADEAGRVSSTAVKAMVIGIILFVCTFLSLYLFRKCVIPSRLSPPRLFAVPPSVFATPIHERPRGVFRPSQYIAYPTYIPSTTTSSIHSTDSSPTMPLIPRKVYTVKTKITAPVAGRRFPALLKAVA